MDFFRFNIMVLVMLELKDFQFESFQNVFWLRGFFSREHFSFAASVVSRYESRDRSGAGV